MADLEIYKEVGCASNEEAFEYFKGTLNTYYGKDFYVNWLGVLERASKYEKEFALLSTLKGKTDPEYEAIKLLTEYPAISKAIPDLMAVDPKVSIYDDETKLIENFDFTKFADGNQDSCRKVVRFLKLSGLLDMLTQLTNVKDYATGVAVGRDTNTRKNRSGEAIKPILLPLFEDLKRKISHLDCKPEARGTKLAEQFSNYPSDMNGLTWDFVFTSDTKRNFLVVCEANHYGTQGSKPPAIAREYTERFRQLKNAGVEFIWITDGLGWLRMIEPLKLAFDKVDYMFTVQMARDGFLERAIYKLFDK